MSATDDMLGIMPPIIVAGAVTSLAKTMFPDDKRKSKGEWRKKRNKKLNKTVAKYL